MGALLIRDILLGVIGALCFATHAQAESWQKLETDTASVIEIDRDRLEAKGDVHTVWARNTYAEDQEEPPLPAYRREMMRLAIDCRTSTSAVGDVERFDAADKSVDRFNVSERRMHFSRYDKDSLSDYVARAVCPAGTGQALQDPALTTGPTVPTKWMDVGKSDGLRYQIDPGSLALDPEYEDVVAVDVRALSGKDLAVEPGKMYRNLYLGVFIDCPANRYFVYGADYYSRANVWVANMVPDERDSAERIQANSPMAKVRDIVCSNEVLDLVREKAGIVPGPAGATGTAWLADKGYLITAYHVVVGATEIALSQDGEDVGTAEIVASDPANDLAVLKPKLNDGPHAALPLGRTALLGDRVFTLGYPAPDALGKTLKMTSGEISALAGVDAQTRAQDDPRFIQVSTPVQSGSSGGPVIDNRGTVIGVLLSRRSRDGEEIVQNVSYAIKSTYVGSLIAALPDLGGYQKPAQKVAVPDIVAELKSGVFLVMATRPRD